MSGRGFTRRWQSARGPAGVHSAGLHQFDDRGAPGIPASGWTRALRGGEPAAGEWLAGGNGYGAMPDEPDRRRIFGPSYEIFLERTSGGHRETDEAVWRTGQVTNWGGCVESWGGVEKERGMSFSPSSHLNCGRFFFCA
jgi:hypothetical protein